MCYNIVRIRKNIHTFGGNAMTFTPEEIKNFFNGCSDNAYKFLGCHKEEDQFVFRVYAPNAKSVRLLGSFNNWDVSVPIMKQKDGFWVEKRKDVGAPDLDYIKEVLKGLKEASRIPPIQADRCLRRRLHGH